MTNKERLDAIKDRAMFNRLAKRAGEITHSLVTLDEEDYDWLIEQAERVRELEVWYHSYHKEAKLNNILKIQNKRYREALEFYADEKNYKPFDGIFLSSYQNKIDEDGGKKARQVLEGEE